MFNKITKALVLLFISIQPVISQVEYFNKIGTQHVASASNGIVEKDSFYYVVGNMIDTTLVDHQRIFFDKYTDNGDFICSKSWGRIGNIYSIGRTSPLISTYDNGYAIIGGIKDSTNYWHSILLKLNNSGDSIWMKHFYDTISIYPSDYLAFYCFKETNDRGFIITGQIYASHQYDTDVFLLKTDSLGNTEWYKTLGYPATVDRGFSVIQTPDSGYLIGGDSYKAGMDYSGDAYLIRTDKFGNKIWDKFLGGTKSDLCAYVALSYDSNYLVGYSYAYQEYPPGYADRTISVVKISPQKQTIWGKTFWIHEENVVMNLIELEDHSIMVIGLSWIIDTINQVGGRHSFIMKLSETGDSLWYRDYSYIPDISNDIFNYLWDIKPTQDGGLIACGIFENYFGGVPQATWLVKTDSMGCDTPGCHLIGITEYNGLDVANVNVYPNPVYDYINIEINIPFNRYLEFELFDCFGRKIKEVKLTNPSQTISLAGINDGMYFYRVKSSNKVLGKGKVLVVK